MNNDLKHIDKLYNESLANYSEEASVYTWARMRWRLLWFNHGKYIIGTATILSLLTIAYFGISPLTSDKVPEQNVNTASNYLNVTEQDQQPIQNEKSANQTPPTIATVPDQNEETLENDRSEIITEVIDEPAVEREYSYEGSEYEADLVVSNENRSTLKGMALLSGLVPIEENINLPIASNQELVEQGEDFQDTRVPVKVDIKSYWFSIGFYVSPAYNFHQIKAEAAYDDHLNYRKENESNVISWSAGADLRFNIRNWYVQTGLTYSTYQQGRNYNYTFKALDSLASYYQTDTIWGWVFDPPDLGEPVVLGYDTTFVPVYNELNEGVNVWRYLEIPLIGGYKFNKGRFAFDIGTGLSYGIFLDASGNVPSLDKEDHFEEIPVLNQNRNIIKYILQLGFSYHLTPNWSLNLSPYYKQNLNSVFDNNYPVDQRFSTIGINFGLRIDL